MKFLSDLKRSHCCGELRAEHAGQAVVLMGWVDTRRDHGGLVFVDLRDREGIVQITLDPNQNATQCCKEFRGEYVIAVQGVVKVRPAGLENKNLSTGAIEVEATQAAILSEAKTPPFQTDDDKVGENLRLKYRYLDLRSKNLQSHLITRHNAVLAVRNYLSQKRFIEVETPILYKSTPEGARDYLVPSRVNLGHFYALPQSPQTLKQLLMIGGMDRYFQIARCFRDEDLRADRQPEFTQIDIEMSFVDQQDVMDINEGLARMLWKEIKGEDIGEVPVITHQEAMDRFGCDKPDLRIPMELKDISEIAKNCGFQVFDDVVSRGDVIKALAVPGAGNFSRGIMDKLTGLAKQMGAKGLVWIKSDGQENLSSPISKFFQPEKFKEIFKAAGGEPNGAVFMVADEFEVSCAALSHLRIHLAKELDLIDKSKDRWLWVVDFPLFEYDATERRWAARHHPFTSPKDEHIQDLLNGNEAVFADFKAKAYDFVCNGYEVGGGSIRIFQTPVQKAMFRALGMSEQETQARFGFFNEALQYGTPPHGGFAWGMDRLAMLLVNTDAIRDVIAFPKTAKATDLMAEAPSIVDRSQLLELGIRLGQAAEKNIHPKQDA